MQPGLLTVLLACRFLCHGGDVASCIKEINGKGLPYRKQSGRSVAPRSLSALLASGPTNIQSTNQKGSTYLFFRLVHGVSSENMLLFKVDTHKIGIINSGFGVPQGWGKTGCDSLWLKSSASVAGFPTTMVNSPKRLQFLNSTMSTVVTCSWQFNWTCPKRVPLRLFLPLPLGH